MVLGKSGWVIGLLGLTVVVGLYVVCRAVDVTARVSP
jgi:hypothetical protein